MTRVWTTCAACLGALAVMATVTLSGPARAGGAEDIEYRKAVMKAVGGHFGAIKLIVTGKVANKDDLKGHAQALADLAKAAQNVFPKGSDSFAGKTEALDKIWTDGAAFQKVNKAFITHAADLNKAAAAGDLKAAAAAFGAMGKNVCKACHDDYRQKS